MDQQETLRLQETLVTQSDQEVKTEIKEKSHQSLKSEVDVNQSKLDASMKQI